MEAKEIKIKVPEGYEIDKENSTFDCIKFKPVTKKFRGSGSRVTGYSICNGSSGINGLPGIIRDSGREPNHSIFATDKQAKSALAMARISQIMANDKRFGGVVTDEQWVNIGYRKYLIHRTGDILVSDFTGDNVYEFLAFHTEEQRDLFLKENEDLVKDYLMIDH